MYWRDHAPAHFHAFYGDYEVEVIIEGGVVTGRFPKRALRFVLEWLDTHQGELMDNWRRAMEREPLQPVPPLE